MIQVLVLGGGRVGSAMAYDLSKTHTVTVSDINKHTLKKIKKTNNSIHTLLQNFNDSIKLKELVKKYDLIVCAVPGFMGFQTLKAIIEAKKNVVDISFFPENALELHDLAKKNKVTALVDFGVAPGLGNILFGYYDTKMKIKSYECYVGGLPKKKEQPFEYKAPFSPIDVIEEYTRPARLFENSKIVTKDALTDLLRYESTKDDGLVSLKEYVDRMKDDQKSIYYITGQNQISLRNSPLLEMYEKKGIEVLILDDEIDEIVISSVPKYDEKELKSVNRSGAADDFSEDKDKNKEESLKPVLKKIKKILGERVKDVKVANRLRDSPSCVVVDENDPTSQMQEMMRSMGQAELPDVKPILEINPNHKIIKKLKDKTRQKSFNDIAFLLYEQALIQEGVKLDNPAEFTERLNKVIVETI